MGVCAIRIDARLIHGQVATLWQGVWNCNRIMVIDSKSANDPMLKSVLKIACPAAVRLSVLEEETAAANLLSGKYGAERITIVTKDPSNLLTLLEKGFRPECDITVGNMSGGNGKVRVLHPRRSGEFQKAGRNGDQTFLPDGAFRGAQSLYAPAGKRIEASPVILKEGDGRLMRGCPPSFHSWKFLFLSWHNNKSFFEQQSP